MKYIIWFLGIFSFLVFPGKQTVSQKKTDISGVWGFAADPTDKGISEKWFIRRLTDKVNLPGSMASNGKGEDITLSTPWTGQIVDSSYFKSPEYEKYRQPGNIRIPFWLQPLKYYKGAAWYQKEVDIPESWKGQEIRLILERCHWESRLWIDDREAGMRNSLGTPHLYDLTGLLAPGRHCLTLRIDNRVKEIDPGINSHSISDHTQTNWNGITGRMVLEAHPPVNIRGIQVYPDIRKKKVVTVIRIMNPIAFPEKVRLNLSASGATTPAPLSGEYTLKSGENQLSVEYPMGEECVFWNEFHPETYRLRAVLQDQVTGAGDTCETLFGMREFKVEGEQIQINGKPVFLRGTLECAVFPETGYPPTDVDAWLRIFHICRAYGLNHMRFHSWCPPEAAFTAADQTGFYLQVECSSWANQSTSLGDGFPIDRYIEEESKRMVETYGNHPSFCMMAYGNEPRGKNQTAFLTEFVRYWKGRDNRRIYTSGAGWPNLPVNDFLSDSNPRIQHWGEGLTSIINARPPSTDFDWSECTAKFTQPMVGHEIGQWCVYPDLREIARYKGVVRAQNFEIFRESLKEHGMEQLADSFLLASGKLQSLCYKADIEAALRTPGFGGFQLLGLNDFPGQGTALVGVLNPFWEEKGYVTYSEYSRFCNATVPLARLKKRIFTSRELFEATIEVAHFGESPLLSCTPEWKVSDESGRVVRQGRLTKKDIPLGNCIQLGKISFSLADCMAAQKLVLEVKTGTFSNSWDFWVYPEILKTFTGDAKIRVTQNIDPETWEFLKGGGEVLLIVKKGSLAPEMGGNIQTGFSSIFWNTAWTRGQAPHTLGIFCNPHHPALAEFPSEYHSNWQWWDAMSHANAINLTGFPVGIKPIVRVIDDWFTNRPLALLFEARVGAGKIVVSGVDLMTDLSARPEARQLLYSLKKYMTGNDFNPEAELSPEEIARMLK